MGVVWLLVRSRRRAVVSGSEELVGMEGEALDDFDGGGNVWIHGERWRATSPSSISKGDGIVVVAVDGLTLRVEPTGRSPE